MGKNERQQKYMFTNNVSSVCELGLKVVFFNPTISYNSIYLLMICSFYKLVKLIFFSFSVEPAVPFLFMAGVSFDVTTNACHILRQAILFQILPKI